MSLDTKRHVIKTSQKHIFGPTLPGSADHNYEQSCMKFGTVIDLEIIFHLIYNLCKSIKNWGQRSYVNSDQKFNFCEVNDKIFITALPYQVI